MKEKDSKSYITSARCVEMDRFMAIMSDLSPLLSQRFPLASAKAQPKGEWFFTHMEIEP